MRRFDPELLALEEFSIFNTRYIDSFFWRYLVSYLIKVLKFLLK